MRRRSSTLPSRPGGCHAERRRDEVLDDLDDAREDRDEILRELGLDPETEHEMVIEAIQAMRSELDVTAAERREHVLDPWDYAAAERDAIQHEPVSRWYRLRHPEV
jgi:hypothetical protein